MPLIRSSGRPFPQREAVHFSMFDADSGKHVQCSISLKALSGFSEVTALWEFVKVFDRFRVHIEGCASCKYDRTVERPLRLDPEDVFRRTDY